MQLRNWESMISEVKQTKYCSFFNNRPYANSRHLCTYCVRIDGINSCLVISQGVGGGGKQVKEAVNKKTAVEFVHSKQQKMKNIYLKDDNGKLWVEVIIDSFLIQFRS